MDTVDQQHGAFGKRVSLSLAGALAIAMVATQFVAPGTPDRAGASNGSVSTPELIDVAPEIAVVTARQAAVTEPDVATQASAALAKMSAPVAEYARAGGAEPVQIIVRVDDAGALDTASLNRLGGKVVRRFDRLGLVAIDIPAGALVDLATAEYVRRVSLDAPVQSTATTTIQLYGEPTYTLTATYGNKLDYLRARMPVHLQAINAPAYTTTNYYGTGQGVAIVDSGVEAHGDLAGRVVQFDFVSADAPAVSSQAVGLNDQVAPQDPFGHGTLVAGLVAGNGHNSSGSKYTGVARSASIVSLRVLDANGQGVTSDAIAAMDWLVQYGSQYKIKVANLSIGKAVEESVEFDPLVLAVEAVWDAGIAVVVAAGNHGKDGNFTITSPGNSPKVITVGSLTDNGTASTGDDYISTYSSRGPSLGDHYLKPDLVAPGNKLVSTIPGNSMLEGLLGANVKPCDAYSCTGAYLEMSGTSMAAPLVSAAITLMYEQSGSTMTPDTAKARLMRTARKIEFDATAAGAGVLDIQAAMNAAGVPAHAALSPKMARATNADVIALQNTALLWGGTEWSNADIWGKGYLWSDEGTGAQGYLWSDEGVTSNGYLWTQGYLWTDGGLSSNGYLWTQGYLWTDVVSNVDPLIDLSNSSSPLNDD